MMEILFVGESKNGFFIQDDFDDRGEPVNITYTGYMTTINAKEIIANNIYQYIVVDVTTVADSPAVTAQQIDIIQKAGGGKDSVVIFAKGFSSQSDLILSLKDIGIDNFIFSITLTNQKFEWDKCTRSKYVFEEKLEDLPDLPKLPVFKEKENESSAVKMYPNLRTIAVAGASSRIGTTTQALQMCKHLILKGYKAAYIDMNNNGFLLQLKSLYLPNIAENTDLGLIAYQGIEMYYKPESLTKIKGKYDFLIYDFGVFDTDKKASYFDKDYIVLVCGYFPSEAQGANICIRETLENDANYIFSFSAANEHDDILELMDDKAASTRFAKYSPDPFIYSSSSDEIYDFIAAEEKYGEKTEKKVRFSFWRKK